MKCPHCDGFVLEGGFASPCDFGDEDTDSDAVHCPHCGECVDSDEWVLDPSDARDFLSWLSSHWENPLSPDN